MTSISVITATLNAGQVIGRLAGDLLAQTDIDFRWIVMDGGSTDDTLSQFPEALKTRIDIRQECDFGIYDALNKGIRICTSDFYLVLGADDRLHPGAIAEYRRVATESGADIVAASVQDGQRITRPRRGKPWLRGQNAYISHHSAGTLFRKSLHEQFGYYSHSLPISADQLFVKSAINGGARLHYEPDFIAGEFSRTGVSSVQFTTTLFEFTLVQLRTEKSKLIQLMIFIARLLRHWRQVVR